MPDQTDKVGIRKTDWILVIEKSTRPRRLINFIKYLQKRGVKFEAKYGNIEDNLYISIHFPDKAVDYFSNIYNISLTNIGHNYVTSVSSQSLHFTKLNLPENRNKFKRVDGTTTKERILIGHEALREAKFGEDENECGLEKLAALGAVKTAYPLHDGDFRYDANTEDDRLNDRQILLKYLANFSVWYKEQPLNLIEKYYGSEVAFYFAWLGFYNQMLVPAAIVGFICFLISIVKFVSLRDRTVEDICSSNYLMCPLCHSGNDCVYKPLKDLCLYAKVSVMFDNYATVFYAIFMSFWATVFLNRWRRLENILKIQWNVKDEEMDTRIRMEYKETTPYLRISEVSGKIERYTPIHVKVVRLTLSYGSCLFFITIVIFALFSVIMFNVNVAPLLNITTSDYLESSTAFFIACFAAILQVVFIQLLGLFYAEISQWLTNLENPRTQSEFDSSVVYKRYFLGFANNYTPLLYIAFVKGRLYTPINEPSATRVETDICHPSGCLMAVCIQLFFLMVMKSFIGNILTLIIPLVPRKVTKLCRSKAFKPAPQWEEEFKLHPSSKYLLTTEFMEMIIQYGFVTFFVAAFPLAPLFALLNNCLELRLDALKLVTRYRRPVPKNQSGIGPWNYVLEMITHLGVATNAFVLAFTSDVVTREMYRYRHGSLDGYVSSTLSVYDMKDYNKMVDHRVEVAVSDSNTTVCYYRGLRYPPDHPKKYELTSYFWYQLGIRLLCVIVFEHVIWISNGILSYFIPDVPTTVKEKIHHDKILERNLKLKLMAKKSKPKEDRKELNILRKGDKKGKPSP